MIADQAPPTVAVRREVLLGDEAVALAAVHAGITAAYAYPGTPSTEIVEFLLAYSAKHGHPKATWSSNEKTAYEEALGVVMSGRRAMVSMKHVGLNVAADPFMNSALLAIHGGLVVAVADDPGMHSSQDEQDSRYYADFARIICLEPANQQEAYEMTREAFDISERFRIPVLLRLVTRLAHSRAPVTIGAPRQENPRSKPPVRSSWILLPSNAQRQWRELLDRMPDIRAYTESCKHNVLTPGAGKLGVITTGLARNYYLENIGELAARPPHLHIGAYPAPQQKVRELAEQVDQILVLEEGYPFLEGYLRGLLPTPVEIRGKLSGHVPADGEMTPEIVREALELPRREGVSLDGFTIPGRPPQLCAGCPHADSFAAVKRALADFPDSLTTADIGCYTLGALPPYNAIESCVCMGASVSMAKGAADAGVYPVVAVIGDSTFLHSGMTPLVDAVAADSDMTLLIVDNETVAMTGGQQTVLDSSRLEPLLLGIGVPRDHLRVLPVHPKKVDEVSQAIRQEIEHHGLSVLVLRRECIETAKKSKKKKA